jgi:hypothetical protein
MAYYCKKPNNKKCEFLYKGVTVGTDRKLCNILSDTKPCDGDFLEKVSFITKIKNFFTRKNG